MIAKGKDKFDGDRRLAKAARVLKGIPALTNEWSGGSLGFNDETDTDSDDQVAPDAVRRRDGNTGVRPTVSTEIQRCSLGLTDSL